MEREHPLSNIAAEKTDYEEVRNREFEELVVGMLLTRFNLARYKGSLLQSHRRLTGKRGLTISAFRREFTTFPVVLDVQRIPKVTSSLTMSRLMTKFGRTVVKKLLDNVADCLTREEDGVPVGLVFNWPRIRGGLIAHTIAQNIESRGCTRLLAHVDTGLVCIETLSQFLDCLEWSHDTRE